MSVFEMLPEEAIRSALEPIVRPWYESLKNPGDSQNHTLHNLLTEYKKTHYGQFHKADEVSEIVHFRHNFPCVDYVALSPFLKEVQKGNYGAILSEPLVCWVMTRGSTGHTKVLPATKTHLQQIFQCGSRALVNHVLRKQDYELLKGCIFNLNFPSQVHRLDMGGQTVSYGYSSGTYARLNPMFERLSLLPRQEAIDSLGPGIARSDWKRRFELTYQQALGRDMTAAIGVTPVILSFAKYVTKRTGKRPKDLWRMKVLFCTSVRKIPYKYSRILKKFYGEIPVVEMYSATEGVFGQQLDDLPYVSPNYDQYLFEVETRRGTKMLHELERGEWGRLIVSTCMFPRYKIKDLVESAGGNYFRVTGRDKFLTVLEHRLYRLFFGWLL